MHKALKNINELTLLIDKTDINGAMVYPFLKKGNDKLRERLILKKIFVAKYWPNVINWIESKDVFEKHLYNNLIPFPIDQRYGEKDMNWLINNIQQY